MEVLIMFIGGLVVVGLGAVALIGYLIVNAMLTNRKEKNNQNNSCVNKEERLY